VDSSEIGNDMYTATTILRSVAGPAKGQLICGDASVVCVSTSRENVSVSSS